MQKFLDELHKDYLRQLSDKIIQEARSLVEKAQLSSIISAGLFAEIAKVKSMISFKERKRILLQMKELISEIQDTKERIEALTTIAVVSGRESDFNKAIENIHRTRYIFARLDLLDLLLIVASGIKERLK